MLSVLTRTGSMRIAGIDGGESIFPSQTWVARAARVRIPSRAEVLTEGIVVGADA